MEKILHLKSEIEKILDNNKAKDIKSINLKDKSPVADFMIIASGNSSRHMQALSEMILEKFKKEGIKNCNLEGKESIYGKGVRIAIDFMIGGKASIGATQPDRKR